MHGSPLPAPESCDTRSSLFKTAPSAQHVKEAEQRLAAYQGLTPSPMMIVTKTEKPESVPTRPH